MSTTASSSSDVAQVTDATSSYRPTTFVNLLATKAQAILQADPQARAAIQEEHPDFQVDGYPFWGPKITPKHDPESPSSLDVAMETSAQTPKEVSEWMLAWARYVVDRRVKELFDRDGGK